MPVPLQPFANYLLLYRPHAKDHPLAVTCCLLDLDFVYGFLQSVSTLRTLSRLLQDPSNSNKLCRPKIKGEDHNEYWAFASRRLVEKLVKHFLIQ